MTSSRQETSHLGTAQNPQALVQYPQMQLRTERLRLRPPERANDLSDFVSTFSDPQVARFMYRVPSPFTIADAKSFLDLASSGWRQDDGDKFFVVVDALTDAFLGLVIVEPQEGGDEGEIGYLLAPDARGRGVMTEAVRAVVRWAHEGAGMQHLFLTTDPANIASQHVAERAGFIKTGMLTHDPPLRGGRTESCYYEWWA
jgi:RimJ/RimL family protein N-acetyltransferase